MSTAADKPVRHILALSGGKPASCARALDMLDPIRTRHYPIPVVSGSMWRCRPMLTMNCAELKAAQWNNAL